MDLETRKVFAKLCFSGNNSPQPGDISNPGNGNHYRPIYDRFRNRASDSEKWDIVFALLLDANRKFSYLYRATQDIAVQLLDNPDVSATDVMADMIKGHEDLLATNAGNWSQLVQDLLGILDGVDEGRGIADGIAIEERQAILNQFASRTESA